MGNNNSHRRTKVPKQAGKERPPDMDKAWGKQQFSSHLKQKPRTKIVLLLPLDKRQQVAEVAADSGAQPAAAQVASQATPPMMRGAGDGAERQEGAREREMKKILVLLLLLDARLQEGRRAAGGANGGAGSGGGAKATQGWLRLYARLVTKNQTSSETDPSMEQPRKRCRCPRPRS